MNLWDVNSIAVALLEEHGLYDQGWRFGFDNARVRAGACKYRYKLVTVSKAFARLNPESEVRDTLLHEIAHAIAGHKAGHGPAWKAVCRRIGAKPVRCYSRQEVTMPEGKLKAVCGGCQRTFRRHKRIPRNRRIYCVACGPEKGLLTFRTSVI